ncbi:MAG: succinate--CoA ligase [Nitratiruptor sp.]|nr:succinate--CoA ligase [Nitratiruptor sp.]NPA83815.1 succinate--CoA ligase [Campylobacterota bacterium]
MSCYTLAHSPDADDLFMYYAIAFGWVSHPRINFRNDALDIETLNQKALASYYDISAISFALYPKIRHEYALLRTAVSFGYGYGPKLVKPKGKRLRPNFKVALSGRHTTNALLFRIAYPKARIVYMNFLQIEEAILQGEVDAGVLIHESILDFDERLEVERELWDIWVELAGEELPLPLGGMVLRRSIPLLRAIEIEEILTKAVRIANDHKKLLSQMLLERNLVRVQERQLDRYLDLYANEASITMDERQLRALDRLFAIGYEHGEYECPIRAKDFLIPIEYKRLRLDS